MKKSELEMLAKGTGETIRAVIKNVIEPALKDIRARLDALEAKQTETSNLKYVGTYVPGATYRKGNFLTWSGSLWACLNDTAEKPPGPDWQLAVKKGRDAA